MSWMLTSIGRHLERVRLIESANITDAGVGPDLVHHEAMLVRLFERAETMAVDDKTQRRLSYALHDHLRRDVEWWVEELHWGMLAGFGAELDAANRRNLIDWMLAVECQLDELAEVPAPSSSRQIWLERLLEAAGQRDGWPGDSQPWRIVPRYCERLGLVTSRPHAPRLRLPGQTWLRLRGSRKAQDDRREALGPDNPGPSSSELAATTMRHARLVAHEVRNALLPVRYALTKVWRELDDHEATRLATPREQIERGINRLYDFVEASVRMSASVDELPPTFVVLDAIEEARRALGRRGGPRSGAQAAASAHGRSRGRLIQSQRWARRRPMGRGHSRVRQLGATSRASSCSPHGRRSREATTSAR